MCAVDAAAQRKHTTEHQTQLCITSTHVWVGKLLLVHDHASQYVVGCLHMVNKISISLVVADYFLSSSENALKGTLTSFFSIHIIPATRRPDST